MSEVLNAVSSGTGVLVFFLAQIAGLFIIPIGLPGTFLQVGAAAVMAASTGRIGWLWVGLFLVIALIGEGIEFLSGQWGAKRFGGSKKAAWGALIGGFVGVLIGVPVPIIGSVIAAFIGTFAGSIVGEMIHQKSNAPNLKVGIGAVIGRAIGVGVKMSLGFIILIISVVLILKG
jgi:uncharacterized protein